MFRANRIGSPYILEPNTALDANAYNLNKSANNIAGHTGNVINAVPSGDFGEVALMSSNTGTGLNNNEKVALLHQFTVTEPLQGNVVGFELQASLMILTSRLHIIRPIAFKLQAAGAAVLDPVTSNGQHGIQLGEAKQYEDIQTTDDGWIAINYKEQLIFRSSPGNIGGTFGHGFEIYNGTGANSSFSAFKMQASVRQLNDQADVAYRDTRR